MFEINVPKSERHSTVFITVADLSTGKSLVSQVDDRFNKITLHAPAGSREEDIEISAQFGDDSGRPDPNSTRIVLKERSHAKQEDKQEDNVGDEPAGETTQPKFGTDPDEHAGTDAPQAVSDEADVCERSGNDVAEIKDEEVSFIAPNRPDVVSQPSPKSEPHDAKRSTPGRSQAGNRR